MVFLSDLVWKKLIFAGILTAVFSVLFFPIFVFLNYRLDINILNLDLLAILFVLVLNSLACIILFVVIQKIVKLKIKNTKNLFTFVFLIFVVAELLVFPLYLIVPILFNILTPGNLEYCSELAFLDPCDLISNCHTQVDRFDSDNLFSKFSCPEESSGYTTIVCVLTELCIISIRYFLYVGPHNPITLGDWV